MVRQSSWLSGSPEDSAGRDTLPRVTPLGFAVFLLFGVCLVLLGANQDSLARDLGLDLTQLGWLGSALALGIGVGVAGAGPAVDRTPRRPMFVGSALLAAAALGWVEPAMSFERVLVHVAIVGLAIGVQETLVNACVTQQHGLAAAKPLIVVHAGATLGAALAPLAIAAVYEHTTWLDVFRATAVAQLLLAAGCCWVRMPAPGGSRATAASSPLPLRELLPLLCISFAYVGVETTLSLYVIPYAETIGLGEARGLRAMSFFWGGLLVGRLALLRVRRRIDASFLLAAGLVGAAVIGVGIGAELAVEAVYCGVGLGVGFVFPVLIALASERAPDARGTATGLVAGAGAAGGLVIPPLHGSLGDQHGVALALLALVAWCLLIAAAAAVAQRRAPA